VPACCRTYQAHRLYFLPQRAYTSIGIVSANRYKSGLVDPTASDAIPQLQTVGAQIGPVAVIVHSDLSNNDRHVVVEGELMRFSGDTSIYRQ
jgi:hypothetical protein